MTAYRLLLGLKPLIGGSAPMYAIRIGMAVCGVVAWGATAQAHPPTALKSRIGIWGLYCVDVAVKPRFDGCSLVTAVASKADPGIGAKLAVAVVSPEGDVEMTVVIPKVQHVRSGFAISSGTGTLVRAPFDECIDGGCKSTVGLDIALLKKLLVGIPGWIEYQTSETETARLALDFTVFGDAVTALYRAVGIGDGEIVYQAMGGKPMLPKTSPLAKVMVEIAKARGAEADNSSEFCRSLLAQGTFGVTTGFEIADQRGFDNWLVESRDCMHGSVANVRLAPTGKAAVGESSIEQVQVFQIYDAVKEKGGAQAVYLAGQSDGQVHAPQQ